MHSQVPLMGFGPYDHPGELTGTGTIPNSTQQHTLLSVQERLQGFPYCSTHTVTCAPEVLA